MRLRQYDHFTSESRSSDRILGAKIDTSHWAKQRFWRIHWLDEIVNDAECPPVDCMAVPQADGQREADHLLHVVASRPGRQVGEYDTPVPGVCHGQRQLRHEVVFVGTNQIEVVSPPAPGAASRHLIERANPHLRRCESVVCCVDDSGSITGFADPTSLLLRISDVCAGRTHPSSPLFDLRCDPNPSSQPFDLLRQ